MLHRRYLPWILLACLFGQGRQVLRGEDEALPRFLSGEKAAIPGGEKTTGGAIETGAEIEEAGPADPDAGGQRRRETIVKEKDATGALELGWIFFEQKQWTSARQWFEQALTFDPKSKRAAEGLIMTAFRSGDSKEAYRLAKAQAGLVPDASSIVAEAAATSGQQWVDAGELEKAERMIEGIPDEESSVAAVRKSIAEGRLEQAVARESYEEARAIAAANAIDDASVSRDESADLLQRASEARDEGRHRESLEFIEEAEKIAPLERSGLRVKAWALYQNRQFDQSAALFETLYREGRDRDSAEGLVNSLQQSGELGELDRLSEELGGPLASASQPVLMAAARAEEERVRRERERKRQAEMALAEAAETREREIAAMKAAAALDEEHPDKIPSEPTSSRPEPFRGSLGAQWAAAQANRSTGIPIDRAKPEIPESSGLGLGGGYRVRDGDGGGLDRLRVTHLPQVETTLVLGQGGNQSLTLGVHVLSLESGEYGGRRLVGSAASTLDPAPFVAETDTLVEPRLAYRLERGRRAYFAEIGASPIGADLSATPLGAVGFEWNGERAGIGIQGFADSVEDSVLSYTGMTDPYTGNEWGRVVKSGVRLDGVMQVAGNWSSHGLFEYRYLDGEGVVDNNAVVADIGLTYQLDLPGFEHIAIGPTFHFESYEKNLSEFTQGHGGYFSPDELFQGMFGLSFLTEAGRSWLAEGFVGVGGQSHKVASAPVLPDSPDGRFYDASDDSSAIFTARLQALFELNPQWRFGAQAGYARSAAYEDFAVSLYLSILFDPEWGLDGSDLRR